MTNSVETICINFKKKNPEHSFEKLTLVIYPWSSERVVPFSQEVSQVG